jgi:zeta-carotene desaturase
VMYEDGTDGAPIVTGLRVRKAGKDRIVRGDVYVAALDCQGAKKLIPQPWRKYPLFDNIYQLEGVPVITVQLRCVHLHS